MTNIATKDNAFKTFCPDLMAVSITERITANEIAPSTDFN